MERELAPVWHDLSRAAHYRYLSRFVHLDPSAMSTLKPLEFALLMQWVFSSRGLETRSAHADERGTRVDLALINKQENRAEFARIYHEQGKVPFQAVYDLLTKLEGTSTKRIYLCTAGVFSDAHKRLRDQFPFIVRMIEGQELKKYVHDAQSACRSEYTPREQPFWVVDTHAKQSGLIAAIQRVLRDWLDVLSA